MTARPEYVQAAEHWQKLGPLARSQAAREIWLPDMMQFRATRQLKCWDKIGALGWGLTSDYEAAPNPAHFDSCDWRTELREPLPHFLQFVCHSACHWLVNLNLWLAEHYDSKQPWRIAASYDHSLAWNGDTKKPVLFDLNYLGLGISAEEAWEQAIHGKDAFQLSVGKRLPLRNAIAEVEKLLVEEVA